MTDEDEENRSRWRLEGEKYPNETKLHNFCASPDQTDKERHLFYAGIPSIWDCLRVCDRIKNSSLKRREWIKSNPIRTALKYSPILSFGMYVFVMIYAEIISLAGISDFVSVDLRLATAIFIISFHFVSFLIFFFAIVTASERGATIEKIKRVLIPFLFYFGLLILAVGTIASVVLVTIGNKSMITAEGSSKANVIFSSGYFLTLYVGGPIVYDGMLRTENLFNNLTELSIVEGELSQNDDSGIDVGQFRQPFFIFMLAVLFVLPVAAAWLLGNGPFGTGSILLLIINVLFDIIIVALVVYFLLVNRTLHSLLSNPEEGPITLEYDPHHPDLTAGYRDFGRFASRVNFILVLSVFYVIYRLYVQGRLAFVVREMSFSPEKVRLGGFISYIMPALAFILVSFVWFYSSFWLMHRAMERERENWLHEMSKEERKEIIDYKDTLAARDAPVWPVDQRFLVAVLSADIVSLGIALSTFFA